MKKIISNKIKYALLGLYLLAPNAVYAEQSASSEFKVVFAKFFVGMIAVAVFSFLIYLGLSLYNRFFVANHIKDEEIRKNSLNAPRDKDEAIVGFIMKNRLK